MAVVAPMPRVTVRITAAANPGARAHQPHAVAHVLPGVADPHDPACIAARLDDLHAAEFPAGRLAGFARRHSGCDVFLDEPIDVQLELFVEFTIGGVGPEQRAQPVTEDVEHAHDRIPLERFEVTRTRLSARRA